MANLRTCRLVTLGCKVNQYETQFVKETLEANGYREAGEDERADLCIVNTCTVTMEGDAKSRQVVRRLHHANPGAAILVMGCYATREPETIAKLPGVTQVITDKTRLGEELRPFGVTRLPQGIRRFDGHQRAFIKVQDGCLLNCAFCIIPKVRPVLRSRMPEEIVEEVAGLVTHGCQEIVLTGVHLGHYGIDLSKGKPRQQWYRLWHLLEKLGDFPLTPVPLPRGERGNCGGDFRIRLSSLEAAEVREDLVRVMTQTPRIVPHLHLCLQSGSDRILERMKRRYRSRSFLERCRRIRQALDQPAFTTDVLVGFPGETEADFQDTCRVLREVGFSRIHVFSYSRRSGTPAGDYPDQVPPPVIDERRQHLLELERELAQNYYRSLIGRKLDVLVEGIDKERAGHVLGTSCRYAIVSFPAPAPGLVGKRVSVLAESLVQGLILGKPEGENGGAGIFRFSSTENNHERIPLPISWSLNN